jgi:hypothetical protein
MGRKHSRERSFENPVNLVEYFVRSEAIESWAACNPKLAESIRRLSFRQLSELNTKGGVFIVPWSPRKERNQLAGSET